MLFLVQAYWPFMLVAGILGVAAGWWYQDPRSGESMAAWLERGPDEP